MHFSGKSCNQERLARLKLNYNVLIVEDASHAIGASFEATKIGACKHSDCSIFSFHPVKNMTTAEGGAITTNNKVLYKKLLQLRNHGMVKTSTMSPWFYEMKELGFNYRLTDIACALGLSQLQKLDDFIAKRSVIAKRYCQAFETQPYIQPLYDFDKNSAYHLFVVLINFRALKYNREDFFKKLRAKNIGVQVHYIPINKQPFYQERPGQAIYTPRMDDYYQKCLSLPIYPNLSEQDQDFVIDQLLGLVEA